MINKLFKMEVEVKSLNISKLFSAFQRENIGISHIKTLENTTKFTASVADKGNILAILEKSLYTDIRISIFNLRYYMKRYACLMVGLVIFFAVAFIPYFVLWDYDVECENQNIKVEVEEILKPYFQNGYGRISSISRREVNSKIMAVKGVSFSEITLTGGKLIAFVVPSQNVVVEKPKEKITATKSAVITKIVVLSGTPTVKVGDKVNKNHTLIVGEVFVEGYDEVTKVKAVGYCYGTVTENFSVLIPKERVVAILKPTSKFATSIFVGGRKIFTTNKNLGCDFKVTKNQRVCGFIPIDIEKSQLFESYFVRESVDVESELKRQKEILLEELFAKGYDTSNQNFEIQEREDHILIKVFASKDMLISE